MNLNSLTPTTGSVKSDKRIARGQGSGYGGTSTKGHKGQKARAGYSQKIGFEGGQMPLQRRVPKFGFKNINRIEFKPINLDDLQMLAEKLNVSEITLDTLIDNGLISRNDLVKILGRGELKAKLNVTANKFSKSAKAEIENKGGICSEI